MENDVSVLIVDDQPCLLANLELTIEAMGYKALTAANGFEALAVLEQQPVDLILADVAMPHMNGYQLFEQVQRNPKWVIIPFIFLTARSMDSDIRYGKELGVDDYLAKPVEPEDLQAAIEGKLRRLQRLLESLPHIRPQGSKARVLTIGPLRIDSDQHRVWLADREIALSAREFLILDALARHAGQVMSPQELVKVTHDMDSDPIEAGTLVRPLILSVRRKLAYPVPEKSCIENVRGVGYRIILSGG